ncbi:hypothetical protein J4E91_009840 [Alternaria rosae]|nr:hypothetical protein J4E91_009840 [Alternaria rosae]
MADVQALGQQVKHINKAQRKVSKLLETGERRQAGTKMHRWLEGGVQKHLQVLHAQAHQFRAGRPLKNKPDQEDSESALRGVVRGKRLAPPSQLFRNRGYTERFPLGSISEIGSNVAEDADPALIAMLKIVPDLRKDAMQDIETQIVFPNVAEYLDVVKRRKLGTFATAHDTSTDCRPQQSHDAPVVQGFPSFTASSSPLMNLRIEGFLTGIRNGTMTEEKVPGNFSIKA